MGSNSPPDYVGFPRTYLGSILKGGPAVICPGQFEDSWGALNALNAKAFPKRFLIP